MKSPISNSIWNRCLFEVIESIKETEAIVEFVDVDALVIEKSKMNLEDFKKWLNEDN